MTDDNRLPAKANRVLNLILLAFLLILIRVWYLSVVQHDEQEQRARKPQRRSATERVERATIRDRFNIPLAINKIQYNATVLYADLKQIPSLKWIKNKTGQKIRKQERLEYITRLATLLAQELEMDPIRIEDLIHSKAALFPRTPFVIKEDISEKQYYRLKILEKEWLGINAERGSKRFYPQGKVACDVLGHMGAISQKEHVSIAQEIQELKIYLSKREVGENPFLPKGFHNPLEVRRRLQQLQEKAYTINDFVGKTGIEGAFEEQLRGYCAKTLHEVDMKGTILRELPGARKAVSGQRVMLSISAELQEFAESLLAYNESKPQADLSTPWIRGGAIIAMIPQTGEVVALASYPRFNPDDFISTQDKALRAKKQSALLRWLENEAYIAEMWDGKRPLQKECFSLTSQTFFDEMISLTWPHYLGALLPLQSPIRTSLDTIYDIRSAIHVIKTGESSHFLSAISLPADKLLALDICRLLIQEEAFSLNLLAEVGHQSLSSFYASQQATQIALSKIRPLAQEIFHEQDFQKWRETHFKDFLRLKRQEEKQQKKYPRPYLDYLDLVEKKLFKSFWEEHRFCLLDVFLTGQQRFPLTAELSPYVEALLAQEHPETSLRETLLQLGYSLSQEYLQTMRSFQELTRSLLGSYTHMRRSEGLQLEKHLAAAFYPVNGYGYGRSQAYRQSTPQGSLFKLLVAYEALREKYETTKNLGELNLLTLIDDFKWTSRKGDPNQILGYHLSGEPITRLYKGGRLPRSSHPHIGKVDLLGAIEQSSNIYFSLLSSEVIEDPSLLIQSARLFGFGERTGIELPGEIAGILPGDLSHNRTGLYAFAIGQHTLVSTPLQTAVMLSAIANRGEVLKPKIIKLVAGKEPAEQTHASIPLHFPFKEGLSLIGIHFPLFTEAQTNNQKNQVTCSPKEAKRQLFFPQEIHQILFKGMQRVVKGVKGSARPGSLRGFADNPKALQTYRELQNELIGKTGTAEILYKHTLDAESKAQIENHIWFGGISFTSPLDDSFTAEPELVVIIYSRFGEWGKESAPLAAQIVKKWREIRTKHEITP